MCEALVMVLGLGALFYVAHRCGWGFGVAARRSATKVRHAQLHATNVQTGEVVEVVREVGPWVQKGSERIPSGIQIGGEVFHLVEYPCSEEEPQA